VHEPIGLLVANVGTPDAPTAAAVRRYLRQFLSDRRVVDLPRALWWPILHLVVLPLRAPRSAHAYARIWTAEGSPLLRIAVRQAAALENALHARLSAPLHASLGMAYGNPSIARALEGLRALGCRKLLVLPLYPQYSSPTTGSAFEAVVKVMRSWRWVPELCTIGGYHDDSGYIAALAGSVRQLWGREGEPERLLLSFHGLPKRYGDAGDPYPKQCAETSRLIAEALGLDDGRWQMSFQSRFGREEWLRPYTDQTLRSWAGSGVASVDVVCPGFAADCLETLEEIDIRYRAVFLGAGGHRFRYIPALNDRADHIAALANIVMRHLQGWTAERGA
jgi:ferrochelatase